ncbi:MAG: fibronectin type III domain-containing protein [Bacteroidales bacterium]|nr:fibronectin type III domain-containing protein [Bacteroidales bacterium]
MKKILFFLLTALIGLGSLTLSAQSVTVANGSATNDYIPVYGLWLDANQHNQIIYPESMLTGLVGEDINTIMFYFSSEPSNSWTSTVTLSMGITANASFSSATHDQAPVSQVYSGNFSITNGTLTFVLDSAFTYNGGNLLLDIATVGASFSSASFLGVSQASASMYQYNSDSGVQSFLPKTMFVFGNCLAPTALSVDSITQSTATFTWQPGDQETAWEVFVGNGTEDLSTVEWIPVSTNSYELEDLTANTFYTVYVRANCGDENSYAVSTSFRTACGITPIPYSEGFESFVAYTQPTCWQFINPYVSYSYNYPVINSNNSHSGNNAFYFYTDYYNNPSQLQYAVLPLLDEHLTNLQLSLYSRRDAELSGTFYIGYITDPTDESTFVPLVTHTGASMGDDNFHRDIVDFSDIPVDLDSTAYIAIAYQNSTYYGWYVDDIEVTLRPECSIPVGLTANDITTNTATLAWAPGTSTTFNVYYKEYHDTAYTEELAVSDTFLLLENLIHSTQYKWYVVAVCDDGSLQTSEVATFSTACAAIDTLPYSVDFEVSAPGSTLPFCWTRGNEHAEYPYIYDYNAYQGENVLYFYYMNTVALPQIDDEAIDIHNTQLSFYAQASDAGTTLQVGVMTNPYSSSTFVPVGNPITLTNTYAHYEVSFASYTGSGKYIAFRNPDEWETLYIDEVTLENRPDCSHPESVWAQTIDSSSVTVAWSALENQSGWEVVIGPHGFTPDAVTAETTTTPSYTFNGLSTNTTYDVYVRTECDEGFSAWSNVMTFLTLNTVPATVPYICGFEDSEENANWTFVQEWQTNQWFIDSAIVTIDGSTYSMYISSDSGATNAYNTGSTSVSWVYRDIQFSDANEFELAFDWKGEGESTYDYLRVYIGNPAPVTEGNNSQPTSATQLAQLNQSSDWQHASFSLGSAYSNTTKRLFFMWRNDSSLGTNPAAAIDNITITEIACAQPANMTVVTVDTAAATIRFTPGGSGDEAWELMYGTTDTTMTTVNITTTTVTLDELTPGTNYYVYARTLCSDGDTSAWSPALVFQTECAAINSVPRFWDFEDNNFGGTESYPMPTCWDRGLASASYPYVYDYDYYAYDGDQSLYFYNSYINLAIMPAIDTEILPINTLQVSFYAKADDLNYYDAQLIVGVVSDIYDMSSFVPVDTIELTEDYPIDPYVVMFNNYTGSANRIAFKNNSSDSYAYNDIYIDNLTLEEQPSCLPVSHITMESNDMTSITLNWNAGFEEVSWNVEYKETSDSVWNTAVASETPFTLDNLNPATMYDIRVQADCGGSDISPWRYIQASTQLCDTANQCEYIFSLSDTYGDGWNGGYIIVKQNGIVVANVGMTSGSSETATVSLCDNVSTELAWHSSTYNSECSFTLTDPFGTLLFTQTYPSEGSLYTFNSNCFAPTCPAPTGIMVSNIDMSNATVTWTPGGDEMNWNVEYKEVSETTWNIVPVTTPSYTINNLTAATLYDVRVQAECDPENSNPSAYDATTFATSTCAAADQCAYTFVLGDSYGDGWNGGSLDIQQNGISVTTVEALNHGGGSTQSYDSITVNLCDGISTSLVWTAGSYADEAGFTLIGPDGTQLYTITGMSGYTTYTFTTDCSGAGPGPVITDPTVATVAASAIAQTAATLNATITNPDNVTISAKGFEWKATSGGSYTQIAGTGTGNTFTANLTGLTANTGYTYKAFITYNGTTVYGTEMTFTTLPEGTPEPCETPTNLHASDVDAHSITIGWNANANVSSWNIRYRIENGSWNSATSNTNTYVMSGLAAETLYEIEAQANCGNGNLSEWCEPIHISTTYDGIDSWLENSVSLYPNPANDVVNVECTMNNVQCLGIEVFDVFGKLINTVNVTENTTRINVSGLANGIYFVRVTTDQGVATKTFVKK